jgi:pimeloyl-ACP methyl ester carboxylesterase
VPRFALIGTGGTIAGKGAFRRLLDVTPHPCFGFRRLARQVRVIWGEADILLPKALIEGIEDLIDDVKIDRIPEGTHWIVHEQPERVNRIIRGFLAE